MSVTARPGRIVEESTTTPARARVVWLMVAALCLAVAVIASLAIGSRPISFPTVLDALTAPDGSDAHLVVRELRVPRTVLGVLAGAAFGVSGALIQAFTRNPLADPGILGVNAGAGFAVVVGVALLGVTRTYQYLPLAFAGALLATALVYTIAARGAGGAGGVTPLRLTLVGVALSAVLGGISSALTLLDAETFDHMRFWGAGSISDRPPGTIGSVAGFIVAGLVLAMVCARSLNAMGLGEETARALGVNVIAMRVTCIVAVTLLCGAATAAAGPIGFVGLMVPHAVRWLTGPDQRWILPFTLLLAPTLLLVSDIVGRLVVWPGELQVGIVTAFIGAPVLMLLIRRTRASAL
nr:iron chelate uptake ABC transporter family permease subunit [Phytoactinopolyspora limicola]